MSIKKKSFGCLDDGREVELYTITNASGMSVSLMTLGAGIQSINVPDKNGVLGDVVLGFEEPKYYVDADLGYQGLVVGRYANRIRDAKFSIDGVEYNTPKNQGTWTLHGGGRFSFNIWEVKETTDNSVTFSFFSPDMEDGFPGDFTMTVKYTLGDDNTLRLDYTVLSNKKTVANPTNHTYFNLSCDNSKTVEDLLLQVNADYFTETDDSQLPTGELGEVKGTMMDFTSLHKIGDKIDEPFRAIIEGVGYDNNYCLKNKEIGKMAQAAVLADEASGRKMEVWTDLPGIQVYCGGWLNKDGNPGKNGSLVTFRRGVALETQFYPDAVNHSNFPFVYVEPNKEFKTATEFRFSVM
ncbi:MAG: galactose mutarotase [Eubacteriales bacterium]|nr:galactose mutarotase [Eubacteriales bacterium]